MVLNTKTFVVKDGKAEEESHPRGPLPGTHGQIERLGDRQRPPSTELDEKVSDFVRKLRKSFKKLHEADSLKVQENIRSALLASCESAAALVDAWPTLPIPDVSNTSLQRWPGTPINNSREDNNSGDGHRGPITVKPTSDAATSVAHRSPPPSLVTRTPESKNIIITINGQQYETPLWYLHSQPPIPPYKSWTGLQLNRVSLETGLRMFYTEAETGETIPLSDDEDITVEQNDARVLNGLKQEETNYVITKVVEEYGEQLGVVMALAAQLGVSTESLRRRVLELSGRLPIKGLTWVEKSGADVKNDFASSFCRMCRMYGCRTHGESHPLPVHGPITVFEEQEIKNRELVHLKLHRDNFEHETKDEISEDNPKKNTVEEQQRKMPCGDQCYRLFLDAAQLEAEDKMAEEEAVRDKNEIRRQDIVEIESEDEGREESERLMDDSEFRMAVNDDASDENDINDDELQLQTSRRSIKNSKQGVTLVKEVDSPLLLASIGAILSANNIPPPPSSSNTKKRNSNDGRSPSAAAKHAAAQLTAADVMMHKTHPSYNSDDVIDLTGYIDSSDDERKDNDIEKDKEGIEREREKYNGGGNTINNNNNNNNNNNSDGWEPWEDQLLCDGVEVWGLLHPCKVALFVGTRTCAQVRARLMELLPTLQNHQRKPLPPSKHYTTRRRRKKNSKVPAVVYQRLKRSTDDLWPRFMPCGCEGPCGPSCSCLVNDNFCEKFCGCDPSVCGNRFRGCRCKYTRVAGRRCSTRQCPCLAAGRECDPDLCQLCCSTIAGTTVEAGQVCHNFRLRLRQKRHILMGLSNVQGWGAFLGGGNSVHKDDFLGEYCGELIDQDEADRRGKVYDRDDNSYLFNLNLQWVIDARQSGNKLRFANHSTSANCRAEILMVDGDHRVAIVANGDIQPGDELFYDYRYDRRVAPDWAQRDGTRERDRQRHNASRCPSE